MNHPAITIGARRISADDPVYVIAEIGVNHNGDAALGHRMIDAAYQTGVDAVKFQTFRVEALARADAPKAAYQIVGDGHDSQREMLRGLELEAGAYQAFKRHCDALGVDFLSTAFDSESLGLIIALDPPCLKVPSGEITNHGFLREIASCGRPVLVSTGMAGQDEIAAALGLLQGCPRVVLQCVSNYPAALEDQNLRCLPELERKFQVPAGFSDHSPGISAALAARALGMAVLEKHFTLDCTLPGPDHAASSEPEEFGRMVRSLREIELALGDGHKGCRESERPMRDVARRSLFYRADFPAGHRLSIKDCVALRPGHGVGPNRLDSLVGRALTRAVAADDMVAPEDFSSEDG